MPYVWAKKTSVKTNPPLFIITIGDLLNYYQLAGKPQSSTHIAFTNFAQVANPAS